LLFKDKHRWKRRWIILDDKSVHIFRSHEDLNPPFVINLMGSAVKRRKYDRDKEFTFDVITAAQSYSFQTDKEPEMMKWVTEIQQVCEKLVLCEIGGKAPSARVREAPNAWHMFSTDQ